MDLQVGEICNYQTWVGWFSVFWRGTNVV